MPPTHTPVFPQSASYNYQATPTFLDTCPAMSPQRSISPSSCLSRGGRGSPSLMRSWKQGEAERPWLLERPGRRQDHPLGIFGGQLGHPEQMRIGGGTPTPADLSAQELRETFPPSKYLDSEMDGHREGRSRPARPLVILRKLFLSCSRINVPSCPPSRPRACCGNPRGGEIAADHPLRSGGWGQGSGRSGLQHSPLCLSTCSHWPWP